MGEASPPAWLQGVLVQSMWGWAATVLSPAQTAKRKGWVPSAEVLGDLPRDVPPDGLGPRFCLEHPRPVLAERGSKHDHLVEEFDRMAEIYDAFVRPFSTPIFDEAVVELRAYIPRNGRLLDAGCGAGRELQRMARLVPEGEVVGIDLSAGMVNAAHRSARAHALQNCTFFQSDVGDLPASFEGQFDLVYSSLAHHHYPEPARATRCIHRSLRPGGVYGVVDPGPEWFNRLASPLAALGDPGWIGFHTPEQFKALFLEAGFERAGAIPLLPGFNLAIAQKGH